jgi:hypothetical protein
MFWNGNTAIDGFSGSASGGWGAVVALVYAATTR